MDSVETDTDASGGVTEVWYRYDKYSENHIHAFEYPVLKHTPKGVWRDNYGKKRFVLKDGLKRFALPTKKEALESYIRRKKKQIQLLNHQLETARLCLMIANSQYEEMERSSSSALTPQDGHQDTLSALRLPQTAWD